ncbi:hypothetical protein U1Q18_030612 [Sarracenia purpurea var. burkii]
MHYSHLLHHLQFCARLQSPSQGKKFHAHIIKSGLDQCGHLPNTLLDVYGKCGILQDAAQLFDEMPHRDAVSWASLLTAHNQGNLPYRTLSIFPNMFALDGLKPDHFVFASLVKACASIGAVKPVSWTATISGYARSGRKLEAVELLLGMSDNNLISWTALISGLVQSGHWMDAFNLFIEMRRMGVDIADPFILSSIIGASANFAALELGKQIHCIVLALGYESSLFVSNSLVDIRSGQLDEAENLLKAMPFKPDEAAWAALLSACKRHGNTQMGIRVANHLLSLEPEDPSTYILLSNTYAGAAMWENVSKVRKLMAVMEFRKEPGYSCIDLGKESEVFYAGEASHPMKDEIFGLLKELDAEMRRRGYVPDTSSVLHDMEQHEKERQLFWHSERLAVAYGLCFTISRRGDVRAVTFGDFAILVLKFITYQVYLPCVGNGYKAFIPAMFRP